MAAQPTEQDVRGFLEMVGSMDRSEVIQRLKVGFMAKNFDTIKLMRAGQQQQCPASSQRIF
jgi:hypothetical protein